MSVIKQSQTAKAIIEQSVLDDKTRAHRAKYREILAPIDPVSTVQQAFQAHIRPSNVHRG